MQKIFFSNTQPSSKVVFTHILYISFDFFSIMFTDSWLHVESNDVGVSLFTQTPYWIIW